MTAPCPIPGAAPAHVGFIVDGNRRWAKAKGLGVAEGHVAGSSVVVDSLAWCEDLGIGTVTYWLLSTDNVARPVEELEALYLTITDLVSAVTAAGYGVRIIGSNDYLPREVCARIDEITSAARPSKRLHVNLAIGYGGRQEILDAARAYILSAHAEGKSAEDAALGLNEHSLEPHLYTAGQPMPDLIIRTSGEQRLSGFFLWQSVHSELVFSHALWPDFTRADLEAALAEFASRERRFGC